MKKNKLQNYILFYLLTASLVMITNVYAALDTEKVTNRLHSYLNLRNTRLPKEEQLNELTNIKNEVDAEFESDMDNPVLWYLKGAYSFSFVYAMRASTQEEKALEEKYYKDTRIAFRKALELDENLEQRLLTADMLFMIPSFGGPENGIRAMRRSLELVDEGRKTEYFYFDMQKGIASYLAAIGRYDEAFKELDKLDEEYSSNPTRILGISKSRQRIKKKMELAEQKAELKAQAKIPAESKLASTEQKQPSERKPEIQDEKKNIQPPPHQQEVITEATKAPVQEKGKIKPAVKATQESKLPVTEQSDNTLLYVLLAIGGVIILFAGVLALRKRKEKS